jgi:hypothetical protein
LCSLETAVASLGRVAPSVGNQPGNARADNITLRGTQDIGDTQTLDPVNDQAPGSKDVQYRIYSAEKAHKYKNQRAQYKQVKIKVDSGAMVSVAPPSTFKEFITMPTYESEIGIGYTSACGTTIPDQGLKQPIIRTKEAGIFRMNMRVAEVTKPLLSVEEMMYKNHRIVFDLPKSYIENKSTGKRTEIVWEDSSPNLIVDVLEPIEEDRQSETILQLNTLEGSENSPHPSPVFHRLATKL